ncbi:MAG TPA: hypothetical protein VHV83_15605 [Armatimonadota bacterium]|nr:hypothetical protein [Armatimonadota bacterium]
MKKYDARQLLRAILLPPNGLIHCVMQEIVQDVDAAHQPSREALLCHAAEQLRCPSDQSSGMLATLLQQGHFPPW